jgi:hypothetical protein
MADVTVKQLANGRTMRQLVLALLVLMAALAVCWHFQRVIYSRLAGPFVATVDELAELPSLDASYRRLFEMNAEKAVRLPFRDVTINKRRGRETGRSYKYFFLVPAAKRPLLLRAGVDTLAFPVTGALDAVPGDVRERLAKVAPKLMEGPGIAAVMLDVEDPAFSFDGILAVVALMAPLIGLGLLGRSLVRLVDFRRVPGVAALKVYGAPIDQVVAHIDGELKGGGCETVMRNVRLTPSWLAHTRRSSLDLVRLEDIVWLYSSVTTKKLYNLIPYSWSYALHLADARGKVTVIKGRKKVVPVLAAAVLERVPWVLAGYSDEIATAFKRDRRMVVAAVAERRLRLLDPGGQGGVPPSESM